MNRSLHFFFLDAEAILEVEAAVEETLPALLAVVLVSYLAGLGGVIWTYISAEHVDHLRFFVRSFLLGSAIQVAFFTVWVVIALLVLRQLSAIRATFGTVFRLMAYGFAPMAIQLVIFPPALDQPIGILALGATLVTTTYALQVGMAVTPRVAFTACFSGFVVFCCILGLLGHGQRNLAPGVFALSPEFALGRTLSPCRTTVDQAFRGFALKA